MQASILGQRLDRRYEVVRSLATGGFGQTYIAEDSRRPGNPKCVVKLLKPACSDPEFLENARRLFLTEAETLEKLGSHDQIPRLLAYFEESEDFYLVQEYVEGTLLTDELLLGHCWDVIKTLKLLREVLQILQFIHSQNVIHRDIKPDNIIRRRRDERLVLVDFGTVKQVRTRVAVQGQATATISVGTPGYMPTEQSHGKPRPSSDIYALGVIAIQAITGLHPNQLQEDEETGELIWKPWADCDPELAQIVETMVRYHFRDRYRSAAEALRAIDSYIQSRSELAQSFQLTSPSSTAPDFQLRPRPTVVVQEKPRIAPKIAPQVTLALDNDASEEDSNRQEPAKPSKVDRLSAPLVPAQTEIVAERPPDKQSSDQETDDAELPVIRPSVMKRSVTAPLIAGISTDEPLIEQDVVDSFSDDLPESVVDRPVVDELAVDAPEAPPPAQPEQTADETADDEFSDSEEDSIHAVGKAAPDQRLRQWRSGSQQRAKIAVVSVLAVGAVVAGASVIQKRTAFAKAEDVIALSQAHQSEQAYEACVTTAQGVPSRYRQLHNKAQNIIGACWLSQAEAYAEAYRLKKAIAVAKGITDNMAAYSSAQKRIPAWSEEILKTAVNNYKQGQYDSAKAIIQAIPEETELSVSVAQTLEQWQAEWSKNTAAIAAATNAVEAQNWQLAIDEAKKVTLTGDTLTEGHPYWDETIQPIVQKAEAGLTAQKEAAQKEAAIAAERAATRATQQRVAAPAAAPAQYSPPPAQTYRAPSPSYSAPAPAPARSSGGGSGWGSEQR